MLLPALVMGCDSDSEGNDDLNNSNLGENLHWNVISPLSWSLIQNPFTLEETYELTLSGSLQNLSAEKTVGIYSIIIRFYNAQDEVVAEHITDLSSSPEFRPAQAHIVDASGTYTHEIERYDVLVTDSQGNEYPCS